MTEEDEAFEELSRKQGDWGMQGSRKHQIMRYAENVENKGTSMTDTCEKHCEATAFKIVIRGLEGEVAKLKERLADPMREVQRLGQEIEQEPVRLQCVTCGTVYADGVPPQVAQPEQEHPVYSPFISCELWRLRK